MPNGAYASKSVAAREARKAITRMLAGDPDYEPASERFRLFLTRFGWGWAIIGSDAEIEIMKHGTDDGVPILETTEAME